jgi:hypothetical protein
VAEQKDDGYIRWRCKACGQKLKVRKSYEGGNVIKCPSCGQMTNVPIGNLEAVAESTDMEETGRPGQLQLDPKKLMERLQGPGSQGSTPSLKEGPWSASAAFGRLVELDQLGTAIVKIEQETLGEIQRLYRNRELNASQRAEEVESAAAYRKDQLRELLKNRMRAVKDKISPMEARHENLSKAELTHLKKLRRALEAIRFYGRYVLEVDV